MHRTGILVALVLALMAVAGCRTASRQPSAVTPIPAPPSQTNPVVAAPPPAFREPPPTLPPRVASLPDTWVPLANWCASQSLPAPNRLVIGGNFCYDIPTANGRLSLAMGTRLARWDGVQFWLGFPPLAVEGQPYVHGLDLKKSILPLLLGPAAPTATNRVLVLDPGHGGASGGATNVFSQGPEKEYTLDWARRLAALLSTNGWTVHLTRTNDVEVTLANRVAFAEQCQAALFISLHFNAGSDKNGLAGVETYCLTPTGMASSLSRDYPDDPKSVYPNNEFDAANFQLAFDVHRALVEDLGAVDRGVRRARFMGVLRGQKRPAVLIEGGFLSSAKEARLIASPAHRQRLAEAVAHALLTAGGAECAAASRDATAASQKAVADKLSAPDSSPAAQTPNDH